MYRDRTFKWTVNFKRGVKMSVPYEDTDTREAREAEERAEEEKKKEYLLRQFEKMKDAENNGYDDRVKHYRDKIEKYGGDPDHHPDEDKGGCSLM